MVKASVSCLVCWQNLGRGCAGRESIRLHHVFFWALVVVRGVSVCSSPLGFQPGVVQAVRPSSPRSAFARVSGWAARFRFGSVGGRSVGPVRGPTRRSRGRGVTLWPVSPSSVRPRPLARALGASTVKEGRGLPSGRVSGLESL